MCYSENIILTQIQFKYGFKPLLLGTLISSDGLQVEIYDQLHDGPKVDYGIGGRIGLPTINTWYSHQIYFRYDLKLNKKLKQLVDPTLYYHTGESPNGDNKGSLLFFAQGIGLGLEGKYITQLSSITLIAGKGNLTIGSDPERKFTDVFMSFSLGLSIHKAKVKL